MIIRGKATLEHSRFYLLRVENPHLKFDNPDLAELETFLGHRWWGLEEIKSSTELFLPEGIVDVFEKITKGNWDGLDSAKEYPR